jgi:UDP-3-O-[3-hydroxymyristoyl] glucosamine N-acyltransferase
MAVTVRQLAALVGGQVYGDAARVIAAARPLTEAAAGDVTFIESVKHARFLPACQASAIVLPAALVPHAAGGPLPPGSPAFIAVADPLAAFVTLIRHFRGPDQTQAAGIDPRADVHPDATLGADICVAPFASIGAGAVIGARCRIHAGAVVGRNCKLGDDVTLHPHVVLYDDTVLGDRVIVHSHAVLGADGFGYRLQDGRHVKMPQFGSVQIGDDVEIGAGTTIDRGTFVSTRVGAGTKIDNQVQIGHNCQIGQHNLIVSQVGIAGSCNTGAYVVIAGQVGIADHLTIGDGAMIGARSGLHRDIKPGERVLGTPPRPETEAKRILLSMERLPDLLRDVRRIKKHLGLEDDPRLNKAS